MLASSAIPHSGRYTAKEALEILLKTDVAVTWMDVSMPQSWRLSHLATMIRQHPRFQRTAIIFISAVAYSPTSTTSKAISTEQWITFPFPSFKSLLHAKVRVFAELHRKTRQLEALNRDLEHRVCERTEELATKAELLLQLNSKLLGKNQELDAIVSTGGVTFSAVTPAAALRVR